MKIGSAAGALLALVVTACGGGDAVAPVNRPAESRLHALEGSAPNAADVGTEALLDWAEASSFGPSFFWSHAATQTAGPFRFRHYPRTGVYLGVVTGSDPAWRTDGVYVMGGPFGDAPLYVGQRADFFTPPPDPAPGGALRFSPATLAVNLDEGPGNVGIDLVATPSEAFSGVLYVVIDDPAKVLGGLAPIVVDQQGRAVTRVRPRDDLPLGLHQGTLQVHLCRTASCVGSEVAGSPVPLPYRFGVVRNDPPLSFSAGSGTLSATVSAGATGRLRVDVSTSRWPAEGLYWRATDAQGFVAGSGRVTGIATNPTSSIELLATPPSAAGRYDGSVQVQVCRDSACTLPVDRQSFRYMLFRTVANLVDAAANAVPKLPPLQPLPGAGDWSGWQGGAAHTGYVPGRFDATAFSLRWQWQVPAGKVYGLAAPTVAQGRVALAAQGFGGADTELFVLDEADGSLRWRVAGDSPSRAYFSVPALSATLLYSVVIRDDATLRSTVTSLLAYDLQTGELRFTSAAGTQYHDSLPPVLVGNRVLVASGYRSGVVTFDASSGERLWSADATGYEWWTPASDGSSVFAYGSGGFSSFALADGAPLANRLDPELAGPSGGGGDTTKSFAVDAGRAFVIDKGQLVAFDTRSGAVLWREASKDHVGATAAQGGTVTALRQAPLRIEARSADDGRLLWSTQPQFDVTQGPDLAFVSDPLLTDSHVFVSTERGVYALSRSDGSVQWYISRPGRLALSANGVLLIAQHGPGGRVTAINLR